MTPKNVNTLLLSTFNDHHSAQAFLFQVARHFSSNGCRVLYIAPEPLSSLPAVINDYNDVLMDPEIMRLITFVYLPTKEDLMKSLKRMHQMHKPPTAIILQEMERYCGGNFREARLVSAMLLNAASTCGYRHKTKATLAVSYRMPVISVIVRHFFHNVWLVNSTQKNQVTLKNINPSKGPIILQFSFSEDPPQLLMLEKVFEAAKILTHSMNPRKKKVEEKH